MRKVRTRDSSDRYQVESSKAIQSYRPIKLTLAKNENTTEYDVWIFPSAYVMIPNNIIQNVRFIKGKQNRIEMKHWQY